MVKYVYHIDYLAGERESYLAWLAGKVPMLEAPEELRRISAYENAFGTSPHRVVVLDFDDLEAGARYFSRPDIRRFVMEEVPQRTASVTVRVLTSRGDYSKG